ncbi:MULTISPECIES: hypothetical protein [unclassified Streptomyces]|uniref:hypothetical protein n=1 Tax=unclassified Streptomyces TaxID=2593676 RepID=UPI00278C72E1|nr:MULTISPECIES: hypothetical protein [unclassified Streptomyces]
MPTQQATVVALAVAFTVTACFTLACLTSIAKSALKGSRSADRARILNEVATILRHLPVFRRRHK